MAAGVHGAHRLVYQGLMSPLVVAGAAASVLSLLVLRRPALATIPANTYLQVLAAFDLLMCLVHIPIIVTVSGCQLTTLIQAYYFAYLGWTLVNIFRTLSFMTLLWLSFDRFLAVWKITSYLAQQSRQNYMRNRMLITVFSVVVLHLPLPFNATVKCTDGTDTHNCTSYVSIDGHYAKYNELWYQVYRYTFAIITQWGPGVGLALCNGSLVVGVVRGKVRGDMQWEKMLVVTMIAMAASHIILSLPITIYLAIFAGHSSDRCGDNQWQEQLRGVGNLLQLTAHVLHIVFLTCLNPTFRRELKGFVVCCRHDGKTRQLPCYNNVSITGESNASNNDTGHQVSTQI